MGACACGHADQTEGFDDVAKDAPGEGPAAASSSLEPIPFDAILTANASADSDFGSFGPGHRNTQGSPLGQTGGPKKLQAAISADSDATSYGLRHTGLTKLLATASTDSDATRGSFGPRPPGGGGGSPKKVQQHHLTTGDSSAATGSGALNMFDSTLDTWATLNEAPAVPAPSPLGRPGKMPHASLPYPLPADCVPSVWALTQGALGLEHDQVVCGPLQPPNESSRSNTMRALKLFSANPCPEIDVILNVINKVMDVNSSVMDLFGGGKGGVAWICNTTLLPTTGWTSPWETAACPWDLLVPLPTVMVVEDMSEDARFAHMPFIGSGVKTYISSPLIASDGHRMGGLCIVDFKKLPLNIGQCRMMNNFAEISVRELERYADVMQRLKDGEAAMVSAYRGSTQTLQRNLASSYDSCIIIIDVAHGFEVLYINQAWEHWSGGQSRDEAIGRTLPELLECASSALFSWDRLAQDAVDGARFVVPRMSARGSCQGPIFDISFRCGALEPLDNDTLPVAIPSFINLSASLGALYIGRFHHVHESSSTLLSPLATSSDTATSMTPMSSSPQQMAAAVIPGLKLGHVLGRGGYGTAYIAEWRDTQVVCKVQDHLLLNAAQRVIAEGEIVLGQELLHPNVVRTLAHGTAQLQRHLPPAARLAAAQAAGLADEGSPWNAHDLIAFCVDDLDEFEWHDNLDASVTSTGGRTMLDCIDMAELGPSSLQGTTASSYGCSPPGPSRIQSVGRRDAGEGSPIGSGGGAGGGGAGGGGGGASRLQHSAMAGARNSNSNGGGGDGERATGTTSGGPSADDSRAGGTLDASRATNLSSANPTTTSSASGGDAGIQGFAEDRDMAVFEASAARAALRATALAAAAAAAAAATAAAASAVAETAAAAAVAVAHTWSPARVESAPLTTTVSGPVRLLNSPGNSGAWPVPVARSRSVPLYPALYPLELRVFLVLELCDKGCLQDAIDRGWLRQTRHATSGPNPAMVLRTALDIAEAMQYLHSKSIIHGDLTGFNILLKSVSSDAKLRGVPDGGVAVVDPYGRPFVAKVADFGTSRRLPTAQEYIRTESYATVSHMPPEMLLNNSMGRACDVWAFGALLWSMWTGSRPWVGLTHTQIVTIVVNNTQTLHFPPSTPPEVALLGARCLSFSAAARPSFTVICGILQKLLAPLPPP